MALRNLIPERQAILDHEGKPLAGGLVDIYEPGTDTRVTSYSDAGLIAANDNPIVLSGSGRASVWIGRNCDVRITTKDGGLITFDESANPDSVDSGESGGLVPNGSFETDSDADLVPDGWTDTVYSGGTVAIDTTTQTDGLNSMKFVSVGANGGGDIITTDFFAVNDIDDLRVNFDIIASNATLLQAIVSIEWFDVSQVSISNSDAYNTLTNPLTWTSKTTLTTPPANARFAKLRIIGIDPAAAVAGTIRYDRVSVFYPAVVAGIFDNITIAGNDIISTNTNGDINLIPNGTGEIKAQKNLDVTGTITGSAGLTIAGALAGVTTIGASGVATLGSLVLSGAITGATDITASNNVNASQFIGALTGNVTGNVSGTAATVTGAAQAAITSVGVLTGLDAGLLNITGNIISNSSGDVQIESISISGSTISGIGAITATTFSGALAGNAATATKLFATKTIGGIAFDGSANIVPQTISVASEGADTTTYIALFNDTTGNQRPKTDSSLFYDTLNNVLRSASYKANAGATIGEFSTDDTLAGSSNTVLPTENAVKNYVDNRQNILQAAMTSQTYGATSAATKFQLDAISGTTGYDLGNFTLSTVDDRITNDTGRTIVVKASLFLLMDGVTTGSGEVSLNIRRDGSIMGESTENFIIGGVDQMLVLERVFEMTDGQYVEGWYDFAASDIMDVFTGSTLTVEYKGDV